jgi:hypothetical protein
MTNKDIIISPSSFHAPRVIQVGDGLSINEIVNQCHPEYANSLMIEINGIPITKDKWNIKPDINDHVLIYAPIMGGGGGKKNPLRIILTIAIIVIAAYTQQWWIAKGYLGGAVGGAVAGTAVATAGMLLVNAIAPINTNTSLPNISQDSYSESPTYSISGGSNRTNPWGTVPFNLGVNRAYPPLGSGSYTEIIDTVETKQKYIQPEYSGYNPYPPYMESGYVTYNEIVGSDEYFRILVIWGYGPLDISDIKIRDTLLSSYSDYDIETKEGWSTDTAITLFPTQVNQETVGVILTQSGGIVQRTAPETDCDELSVDLAFPNGLVEIEDDGTRTSHSVTVLIQYREVGAGSWTTHETKVFTDRTTSAIRYGTSWTVDNTKEYEIGITRQTADSVDDQIIDDVYWVNLRCTTCGNPIQSPYPVAATAIKIKATDQLNGPINTINAIVSSYAPVWDDIGGSWSVGESNYEITQNPAALYRHVLTCEANAKARTFTQVDNDALGEWYEFCDTNGYKFNYYKDTQSSVWDILSDIASAGRASPSIVEGLWTVAVDTGDQALVQHITPRNSWGFSSEKVLFDPPHAFRIRFVNEDNDYAWDERIVYDDGYNYGNATLFESITLTGITDPDLIWKFGRFHIAQARLRPEVYTLNMDFEHLVCNRGSKVRVSHDVPLWGVGSGRVKTLTLNGPATHITHVTLDEYVTMESGNTYVCRFRLASGDTLIESIVLDVGETNTLEFTTPVLIASGPETGDLAMFGITDLETVELLVTSITRSTDLTAQLQLVDFAEDIYDADTGEIPAFNPSMTLPTNVTLIPPDPPTIDDVSTGLDVSTISGGGSVSTINVYLTAPENAIRIRGYRVRYRLVDETVWTYTLESRSLTIPIYPVSDQQSYEIQAQSISVYGIESQWTSVETGSSDMPQIVPDSATGISSAMLAPGGAYDYGAILVTFTPPDPPGVYAYSEIYACNDDSTYRYVGRDSTGSFVINKLGSLYKVGDTCYIKLRSVSKYEIREPLPGSADTSVVVQATIKIASFYFGLYDQWAGNASIGHADTKIVIGNLDGTPQVKLGPSADSITFAGTQTGAFIDGDGYFRVGSSTYGMSFNASTGVLHADKLKVGSGTYIDIDGGNARIRSSNYVSGYFGAGFTLEPDLLEVGNVAVRGIIRTSVFQYDSISAHGGSRVLAYGADVLAADMTALDASTLTIEGNETWSVGDILRIKEDTDDEWLTITNTGSAPTYSVTRDEAGNYGADSNPAWTKGAAVVNYGQSGDGGIYETASEINAPYQSIYIHSGSPWSSITTLIREGNLNGYAGYTSDLYGWAAYIDADNYITIDPTNGISMSGSISISSFNQLPSDENLVADWSFDDGSGTLAIDNSGNGINVTLYNAPTWVNGISGKALSFTSASNQYGVATDNLSFINFDSSDEFSISGWFKTTSFASTQTLISRLAAGPEYTGYYLSINTSGQLVFGLISDDSASDRLDVRTGALLTDTLYKYLITYDGSLDASGVHIYIDTVDQLGLTVLNDNLTGSITNVASLYIGARFDGEYYNGILDETKIYNKIISDSEEKALYLNPSGNQSATVGGFGYSGGWHNIITASGSAIYNNTTLRALYGTEIELYDSGGTKKVDLSTSALYLGDQSNEHLKASSTGIEIKDGSTVNALFGTTSYLGIQTDNHLKLYSTAIELKNSSTVLAYFDQYGFHSATQPSFLVHNASSITNVTGDGTTYAIVWPNEEYDQGSNISSGVFTAPTSGIYIFTAKVRASNLSVGNSGWIRIVTSNRIFLMDLPTTLGSTSTSSPVLTTLAYMDASDTAYVDIQVSGGTKTVYIFAGSTFSGQLVA